MDIPTLRKVIELYLRGFGYQEILRRAGIASCMRLNGTWIEDSKMSFQNASVLSGLNIDLQELYSFYDAARGY